MYNLRYHLASLVAVFLALAVGLLLGTVVAERGMITNQANELVGDLQRRFDEINATNDELKIGLERDRAFAEAAVEPLTAGQLTGSTVAVLVGTGRVDGVNAVSEAVARAGGAVFTASMETPSLGLDQVEPEGLAGYFQLRGIEMAAPGEALQAQVAEALVAEWRSEGERPLTELLASVGLLATESVAGTATVNAVVVMGGAESSGDTFGLAVARAMTAAGGSAVGVESSPAEGGVAAVFAGEGLSAVDHIGTPQGRVALVWLLARRVTGYYGSGSGAAGFYPPLGP
jgi:hypothetical protein